MSNIGCSTCPKSPLNELAIICSFVCVCDIKPLKSRSGSKLKQACVNKGIEWMHESGQGTNILPEVGYFMGESPPRPLLKNDDADLPEPIKNHWHRFNKVKGLLKEQGETYSKGLLRIPDVIITKDPSKPPTQDNIKKVVEVKFPGDTWGEGQKEAYEDIAADPEDLELLTPDECGCNSNSKKTHPELENAWSKERDRQESSPIADAALVVAAALGITVLVLDDLIPIGVTQADDALIPVAGGVMARSTARLVAAFLGVVAVPALTP